MTDAASTTLVTNEDDLTPAERQARAREAYLASLRAGTPLTGAELGRRFDRTDRWGRYQIDQARTELHTEDGSPSPAARNGKSARPEPGRQRKNQGRPDGTRGFRHRRAGPEPAWPSRNGHPSVPSRQPILGVSPERSPLRLPDVSRPASTQATTPTRHEGLPLALTMVRWLTTLTVIAIALAAGRASYDHQRAFAEMAGEDRNAWSLPLSVDGMMVVASLTMLVRRWQNKPAGRLAWAALILGGLASLAANITVAEPTMAGRLAAAWPPLCLLVSIELLLQQIRDS